jgi:hypothetical protein
MHYLKFGPLTAQSEGAECSKQPYRNGTTVLGNLTPLFGVPDDADREAQITSMPSINAAALDLVPARLTVFSVCWEALPVVEAELAEPPEVHEPLFGVVVVLEVARLLARWANRTLDNSITMEKERIVFFTAPPFLDIQRSLWGGEPRGRRLR